MEQLNLNLIPGKTMPVCHVSQYDVGRTIRFNLFNGSTVYTFAGTETAEVHIRKPDDTVVTKALTVVASTSYVEVSTTQQMTACAGSNIGEIQIKNSGNVIGSLNFVMEVEADPMDDGNTESESEIHDLQQQVNDAVVNSGLMSSIDGAIRTLNDVVFESGAIASGNYGSNNKRIRTTKASVIQIDPYDVLYVEPTYEVRVAIYTSGNTIDSGTFVEYTTSSFVNGMIEIPMSYVGKFACLLIRKVEHINDDISGDVSVMPNYIQYYKRDVFKFKGFAQYKPFTAFTDILETGWYGFASDDISNMTDRPIDCAIGGATLCVFYPAMARARNFKYLNQILIDSNGTIYWRKLTTTLSVVSDWVKYGKDSNQFAGKTVAILGASNDTNGDPGSGENSNAVEIEVTEDDVGVQLSAYLTYYDVQDGLTLGGHTFTSSEIGNEVTFTPLLEDVGKVIGKANNYNSNSLKVWWETAAEELGFNPVPVCWSGSSITSHEATSNKLKTAHAWHDAQIRKCGIRTPGTMTRTAPDLIIIARGLNDYSHTPYDIIEPDYLGDDFVYPVTDEITGGFGFYQGLALTIKKLRAAYPKAEIALCTMKMALRPSGGYDNFPPRTNLNTIVDYSEAFRKAANFFGCHLIELDKCGITFENFLNNYCIDTTSATPSHANQEGHNLMGARAIIDMRKINL